MRGLRHATLVVAVVASSYTQAAAQDAALDAGSALTWRTSIKIAGLFSRTPVDPELFPQRNSAESLWRIRTEPEVTIGSRAWFSLAYEQRVRWQSDARALLMTGVLPANATAPFRVIALDWTITSSNSQLWQHEIDRLNLRLHLARTDLTIGRQAIGWGRGVMFGAVDLFAPFSPLEADREWRRGIDAVRADVKLTDRSSMDFVTAFGHDWDSSALAARVRGYAGPVDVELMGGRRGRDAFTGVTSSAAIGDAAVHGEAAVFRIPLPGGGAHRLVWKTVAGGSYRLPWGSGVIAYAEYHFSGFGAARAGDILPQLATPDFAARYLRGDTQILSRHAVAFTGSYEQSPDVVWSGQWVLNPADGSGIAVPGFTFTVRQDVSVAANAYLPYGRTPAGAVLRSEYGATPLAALLQLRIYF